MQKLRAGKPVDPAAYYFRCTPAFETAAPAHCGTRRPDRVEIDAFLVQ